MQDIQEKWENWMQCRAYSNMNETNCIRFADGCPLYAGAGSNAVAVTLPCKMECVLLFVDSKRVAFSMADRQALHGCWRGRPDP